MAMTMNHYYRSKTFGITSVGNDTIVFHENLCGCSCIFSPFHEEVTSMPSLGMGTIARKACIIDSTILKKLAVPVKKSPTANFRGSALRHVSTSCNLLFISFCNIICQGLGSLGHNCNSFFGFKLWVSLVGSMGVTFYFFYNYAS